MGVGLELFGLRKEGNGIPSRDQPKPNRDRAAHPGFQRRSRHHGTEQREAGGSNRHPSSITRMTRSRARHCRGSSLAGTSAGSASTAPRLRRLLVKRLPCLLRRSMPDELQEKGCGGGGTERSSMSLLRFLPSRIDSGMSSAPRPSRVNSRTSEGRAGVASDKPSADGAAGIAFPGSRGAS
jgi:hypothetical protein